MHERHLQSDLLLGLIAEIILQRDDLRLVLMSATINLELFQNYFEGTLECLTSFTIKEYVLDLH